MAETGAESFRAIYLERLAAHGRIAGAVARLYTPPGEEVADLEQEIRLQWWRSLPGFAGESKASTWMYQVALHTALTGLRRRGRRLRPGPLPPADAVPDPAGHPGSPQNQGRRDLLRALAGLEPGERALAFLWLEECSYEEIAAVTGLKPNAVGVRLHRLRARLKELLAGGGGKP